LLHILQKILYYLKKIVSCKIKFPRIATKDFQLFAKQDKVLVIVFENHVKDKTRKRQMLFVTYVFAHPLPPLEGAEKILESLGQLS